MVQNARSKIWDPAIIIKKCDEPRSFIVQFQDGRRFRRTSYHLRKLPADFVMKSNQKLPRIFPLLDKQSSNQENISSPSRNEPLPESHREELRQSMSPLMGFSSNENTVDEETWYSPVAAPRRSNRAKKPVQRLNL